MKTVTRNIGTSWRQVTQDEERPHAGRFEQLTLDAERSMRLASDRLELIDQCRRWINPGDSTEACMYEVTPGGLTYQDAALQCLMGGCVESLEVISTRAARAARAFVLPRFLVRIWADADQLVEHGSRRQKLEYLRVLEGRAVRSEPDARQV